MSPKTSSIPEPWDWSALSSITLGLPWGFGHHLAMFAASVQSQQAASATADVGLCTGGRIRGSMIGFVDQHQVRQLHDSLFDGLQIVTRIRAAASAANKSVMPCYSGFTLTHTHGFNDHHIVSSGLAHQNGIHAFFPPRHPICRCWGWAG